MDQDLLMRRQSIMTTRNWLWLSFRIAWIIVGLFQGPHFVSELSSADFLKPSWVFPIKLISVISIGMVAIIGIQASKTKVKKWPRPSWFENPFGLDRPVSIFEAGAYYVLAGGVSSAFVELRSTPQTWAWELLASAGVGLWLGAQLCLIVYRKCFVTSSRAG
jgi:hypothetical protein